MKLVLFCSLLLTSIAQGMQGIQTIERIQKIENGNSTIITIPIILHNKVFHFTRETISANSFCYKGSLEDTTVNSSKILDSQYSEIMWLSLSTLYERQENNQYQ